MRTIFIFGVFICYLDYPASSKEMTKEGGRARTLLLLLVYGLALPWKDKGEGRGRIMYTLVLLVVYGQRKENHEPAVGLLRDVMVCVVLNFIAPGGE
jgi:hypothetical protein